MKRIIVVVGVAVLALSVGAALLAFIVGSERGFADNTETVVKCFSSCGQLASVVR
jgi:hypothetical protein